MTLSDRLFSIVAASISLISVPVSAALGGPSGIVIPYAGKLELDGALVTGAVDFEFGVAPDAGTAAPTTPVDCVFTLPRIPVTNGEFAVSIAIPVARESCVKGKDVHLNIAVRRSDSPSPTFVPLGKQRVTPVVAAATSGVGDFDVAGALTANTAAVGALSAGATTVTGNLTVTGSISVGLVTRFCPATTNGFCACNAGEVAISGGGFCPAGANVTTTAPFFDGWVFACGSASPVDVVVRCARLSP